MRRRRGEASGSRSSASLVNSGAAEPLRRAERLATPLDRAAAERGRTALICSRASSNPSGVRPSIGTPAGCGRAPPRPGERPGRLRRRRFATIRAAPRPYPNDGLPMGLRKGSARRGQDRPSDRLHGSVTAGRSAARATSVWATPSSTCRPLLNELTIADGRRPASTFVLNTSRGTNNAGKVAAVLLSLRNPDLSFRCSRAPGRQSPRDGHPALVAPEAQADDVLRRPHRRPLGPDQHAVHAGREDLRALQGARAGVPRRPGLPPQPRAAQISIRDRRRESGARRVVFQETCTMPRDLRPDGQLSQQDHPARKDRHRPARSYGLSDRLVAHYNSTWLGAEYPVQTKRIGYQAPPLDGIWASAPYLHNGTVPTLHALLDSKTRPAGFTRPPSTDFAHYDTPRRLEVHRSDRRRTGVDRQAARRSRPSSSSTRRVSG